MNEEISKLSDAEKKRLSKFVQEDIQQILDAARARYDYNLIRAKLGV